MHHIYVVVFTSAKLWLRAQWAQRPVLLRNAILSMVGSSTRPMCTYTKARKRLTIGYRTVQNSGSIIRVCGVNTETGRRAIASGGGALSSPPPQYEYTSKYIRRTSINSTSRTCEKGCVVSSLSMSRCVVENTRPAKNEVFWIWDTSTYQYSQQQLYGGYILYTYQYDIMLLVVRWGGWRWRWQNGGRR